MTPDTITIGGREFRVGAIDKPGWDDCIRYTGPKGPRWMMSVLWLRWAGDEVRP